MKKDQIIKSVIYVFLAVLIFSCGNNDSASSNILEYQPKEAIEFNPEIIASISDSFNMIISSDFYGNYFVVLDMSLNKCFIYENYELKTSFGSKGEAPGEFNFMGVGIVCFTKNGDIAIYDPANSRVQMFSVEGELLESIKIGYISPDFDILNEYFVLTSIMGDIDLIFLDKENGEKIKEYNSTRNINLMEEELPPPIRIFEIGNNEQIYLLFTDEYKISAYTFEDSIIFSFSVKTDPIPFDEEIRNEMIERVPQFAERIRKYQYQINGFFVDKEKDILWVNVTTENNEDIIFDLFDNKGNYLKRIKLIDIKGFPIEVNNGRLVIIDQETMGLNIYDVFDVYKLNIN